MSSYNKHYCIINFTLHLTLLIFNFSGQWGHQHSQDNTSFHSRSLDQHKVSCHNGYWLLFDRLNFLFNHLHSTEWQKILWLQVLFPVLTQNQNVFFITTKLTVEEKALLSREMYWLNVKVRLEPSQFCQCSSFQHTNFWYLILVSICC